jgi:hypothetical protein
MSIDMYMSHLSCMSIELNLQVPLHDNNKYLMLRVASGCYDPLGADDRAGGIALPSVLLRRAGKNAMAEEDGGGCFDANAGSRPWDICVNTGGDSDDGILGGSVV